MPGASAAVADERPTIVKALGRLPTQAEYAKELSSLWASCVYDMERFFRLTFPLGAVGTPLQRLKTFYPWQQAFFRMHDAKRRHRGYVPDGEAVEAILHTISSGKGAGKTVTMAGYVWYLMATCPWAQGLCTSTTGDQLKDRLWANVKSLYECSPLLQERFDINSEMCWHRDFRDDWKCVARVPSKENPEALQGIHGVWFTFAVGDEASGIPKQNFVSIDGMLGDPQVFMCFASNPLYRTGVWYDRTFGVDRVEWGHTESPENDPLVIDRSSLPGANQLTYDKLRARHGFNSNHFRITVRGLPPLADSDQLIDPETIERAADLPLYQGDMLLTNPEAPLLCGVDLPKGGDDRFVAWFRKDIDARTIPPVVFKGRINSFTTVVKHIRRILNTEYHGDYVHTLFLDAEGHGMAAYDELAATGYRKQVIPIYFQGGAPDPEVSNMRAYMYRESNEWIERGGRLPSETHPYGGDLHEELSAQRKDDDARRFQLIKKKIIKEALGRSPDCSDAFALTFSERVRPLNRRKMRGRRGVRYRETARVLTGRFGWQC